MDGEMGIGNRGGGTMVRLRLSIWRLGELGWGR